MVPAYKVVTKNNVYSIEDSDIAREKLVEEQDLFLKENGYELDKSYMIHFFDSFYFDEHIYNMDIYEAIQCLAIKDGVDFVKYENGNYGYVAYYNGHENGFEILGGRYEK